MKLNTRLFELYKGKYRSLTELARVMGISRSQIYRVRDGKRSINQKFIIGATKGFPEYNLDDLFYVEGQLVKQPSIPLTKNSPAAVKGLRVKMEKASG